MVRFICDRIAVIHKGRIVELSESEYARFYQSPLAEYDFISKHRGAMRQDADGTRHCLLVLGENQEDGILVDAEGYDYARYSAYIRDKSRLSLWDIPVEHCGLKLREHRKDGTDDSSFSHAGGHWFESSSLHQLSPESCDSGGFLVTVKGRAD